jgi:hypothetical protein
MWLAIAKNVSQSTLFAAQASATVLLPKPNDMSNLLIAINSIELSAISDRIVSSGVYMLFVFVIIYGTYKLHKVKKIWRI